MTQNIEVLTHSSIRITGKQILYVDPFEITKDTHDADIICFTHDHFDHFSPKDIAKVIKEDTTLVMPESMAAKAAELSCGSVKTVVPGTRLELGDIVLEAVAAYNKWKPFHPKKNGWVGYIFTIDGVRIYVAGDTDSTEENQAVSCDVAMVPIGGTFTMDAKKAAALVNIIRPKTAIPIHYGSVAGKREAEDVFRAAVDQSIPVEIKMQRY